MCMGCNSPKPAVGSSSSSRQSYRPAKRIVGTNFKRQTSATRNNFGSPKVKMNFAPRHR